MGHVFKRDFKVWKVFNNFADFRSFSEKMKYKKTNDISKIVEVLCCLRVFYATPNYNNLQKNFCQKYLKLKWVKFGFSDRALSQNCDYL